MKLCYCADPENCTERVKGYRCRREYAPTVPGPAKDDGTGRISAYDTTWPDVATRKPHTQNSEKP